MPVAVKYLYRYVHPRLAILKELFRKERAEKENLFRWGI